MSLRTVCACTIQLRCAIVVGEKQNPPPQIGVRAKTRSNKMKRYRIQNRNTGTFVSGLIATKRGARRSVDRRDNEYGGYVHRLVRFVGSLEADGVIRYKQEQV